MAKLTIPIWGFDEGCCRIYLFVFNILFSTSGFLMICLGLWMLISFNKLGVLNMDCVCHIPWLTIAYGLTIVACTFASYLFLRKSLFLFIYASCLFILFVFGISLGVLITLYNSRIKDSVTRGITFHMENYLSSPKDTVMDRLQIELECCGNMEPNDWLRTSTGQIPPSCCKSKLCDPTKLEEIYSTGCFPKLMDQIKFYTKILGLAAVIGSLLPLLGCILSFTFAYHSVDKKYQQVD